MAGATLIGLDIGSTSIRALEASVSKDQPVIHHFGQALLPEGAVVGGVVKDERVVTSALRQMWTSHKFGTKNVVLGVAHQQVIVRELELSNLPAKELAQALPFLVRDVLPLPVDQAVIDFYPLEKPGKKETVRGLVIAAPREAVIETVHAVEAAGLHVHQVDLACFATLRAAAQLAEDTEALLDIGANGTTIVVHTDGVPNLVRTVPRGGAELTKALTTRLGITTDQAEELKCRAGLVLDAEQPEAAAVIQEALRPLITELRSSFSYYANTNVEAPIQRVALVGGGALLPGLTDELSRQLGVPAFLPDPLQRVNDTRRGGRHDNLDRFRSAAAVSIGLTLGAA